MGLFDFVKDAGAKLFGGGGPSPEEKATILQNNITKLGLDVSDLRVAVTDDVATPR